MEREDSTQTRSTSGMLRTKALFSLKLLTWFRLWSLREKLFYSFHQFEEGWIRNSWGGITTDQVRSGLATCWFNVYSRTMLI